MYNFYHQLKKHCYFIKYLYSKPSSSHQHLDNSETGGLAQRDFSEMTQNTVTSSPIPIVAPHIFSLV